MHEPIQSSRPSVIVAAVLTLIGGVILGMLITLFLICPRPREREAPVPSETQQPAAASTAP